MTQIYTREQILQHLNLDTSTDLWRDGWAASQESYVEQARQFIEPAYIDTQCQLLEMEADMTQALINGVRIFDRQPMLKQLLWHCHYVLFKEPTYTKDGIWHWPRFSQALNDVDPLFYTYVCLSNLPGILTQHEERGVPQAISVDTLSDLNLWIRYNYDTTGVWGLPSLGWLSLHFTGGLYKLGRLQFELKAKNWYDYPIYRHQETGQIVALAADGLRFRQDGFLDGTNDITDAESWEARLEVTDQTIIGHPIDRRGFALRESVTLPASQWALVLKKDDPVLGVHIPATGPMNYEECGKSFARALPFFQKHFPDYSPKAFTCSSWLLDDQFTHLLPPTSNIVRFMQPWQMLPLKGSGDGEVISRVFHINDPVDLDTLPQTTSLERAVVAHLKQGGHFRGSGGVIIPDDHLGWGMG